MKKLEGTNLVVIRHSLCNISSGQFFYSDIITALIEDNPKNEINK